MYECVLCMRVYVCMSVSECMCVCTCVCVCVCVCARGARAHVCSRTCAYALCKGGFQLITQWASPLLRRSHCRPHPLQSNQRASPRWYLPFHCKHARMTSPGQHAQQPTFIIRTYVAQTSIRAPLMHHNKQQADQPPSSYLLHMCFHRCMTIL